MRLQLRTKILVFSYLLLGIPGNLFGDVLLKYHQTRTSIEGQKAPRVHEQKITIRLASRLARIDEGAAQSCIVDFDSEQTYFLDHVSKKFERYPHPTSLENLMHRTKEGKETYELRERAYTYEVVPQTPAAMRKIGERNAYNYKFTVDVGIENRYDYDLWLTVDVPLDEQQIQLYKELRKSCESYVLSSGSDLWLDTVFAPDAVEVVFEMKHTNRPWEITTQRRLETVGEQPTDPSRFRPPADYQLREFDPSRYLIFKVFKQPSP